MHHQRWNPRPSSHPAALWLAALCLLLALVAGACSDPAGAVSASESPTAPGEIRLEPRDFVRTIRATGTTEATQSHLVIAPRLRGAVRGNLVITSIAAAGTAVRAGDVLVEFDRQAQDMAAFDRRAEYRDLIEQIAKTGAEQEAARVKDDSDIEQAVNAVASLELESLKNEMLARIDAQANEQKLEAAKARLDALRRNLPSRREADAAALRILAIKRERARLAMEDAERNAQAMVIRSPIDGLVVAKMTWRNTGPGDVQEGDDVWPGMPLLEVVNADTMRVRAKVNQADVLQVRPGLPVSVRLDAYDDLAMPGRVDHLAPLAAQGSFSARIRTFATLVSIDGTEPRMMPDLTASVDIEVERVRDALVVPRAAVRIEGETAYVLVRSGGGTARRAVTLGPRNEIEVVVTDGLKPGEVVVL